MSCIHRVGPVLGSRRLRGGREHHRCDVMEGRRRSKFTIITRLERYGKLVTFAMLDTMELRD